MTRKTIATYGPRRASVRVFVDDAADLVRVQWRESGMLRTRSWPNSTAGKAEAKAWARGFAEARTEVSASSTKITLADLWKAFCEAEFPHLRENTKRLYTDGWMKWQDTWNAGFVAENATPQMLTSFRSDCQGKLKLSINTTRIYVRAVKRVYGWAEEQELIARNRLARWRFKVGKDARPKSPAEFRQHEHAAIMAQLDPQKRSQWRAHVALALCGFQGVRQHAVLHLRWDDVDLEKNRITWRAEWDKTGKEWSQPIRRGTRKALEWALKHREGTNPWVIPAPRGEGTPYTIQSLWWSLKAAQRRAGVENVPGRAGHGLRRMLAGNVMALTANPLEALRTIGDKDLRMADPYLKERDDRTEELFRMLDEQEEPASE